MALFGKTHVDGQTPASVGLRTRSARVDNLIGEHWPDLDATALVAVGGFGRGELFPCSDIDLLFLSKRQDLKEPLAPFLRTLWDAGLRVSQSVHAPDECLNVDERNIELSVSLLDRRFLLGDRALFDKLRDPSRERLAPAISRMTRDRHARYGNTIYHLEPNVKESPGALRDLQVLRWLAQLDGGAPAAPPHELLFRIRTALHEAGRRDQNVLGYALQDECSSPLGFADPADMMRAYYREAAPIHRACLRLLDEAESKRSPLFAAFRDRAARLSNVDFSVIGGRVYFRNPPSDCPPLAPLFEFVARHGLPLARATEDRVRQCGEATITWRELRAIFDLPHIALAVRAMHDTGFMTNLFPEMRAIEALVVRDFYHRYTVDEHTLVAIETAEKLRRDPGKFGELAREAPSYPLLLAALLFHDAGKGVPSENHSAASVQIASRILDRIEAPASERETILYLIDSHLEMSRLMLTRDLTDPATAAILARSVGTVERLKLLTLLTFCDISAVNPEAMTPWRSTLLWRLHAATARHLTLALESEIADEGLPARYTLSHSPEEIAEHHRMERDKRVLRLERLDYTYRLSVVAPDRAFLFAHIAGALAGFGMNIVRADSFRNERGFAIETFSFVDPARTLELNPSELPRFENRVGDAVSGRGNVEELLQSRTRAMPRRIAPGVPHAQVSFDNTASPRATLFEITAEDRSGLLYDLALSISIAGCNIDVVLVDTEGRKAIDVFYVTRDAKPLDDDSAALLRDALLCSVARG